MLINLLSALNSLITFLIVIGIIILVHEFGHYIACRLTGVRVEVFSIGFGKRLFGKKVGATDFRFSLFPVGGYVRMAGEELTEADALQHDEFPRKNRAQKIFILLMGAAMNVLLAYVLLTVTGLTGIEVAAYQLQKPTIGYVDKDSPADKAGLLKGDTITAIDGRSVGNWRDLELTVQTNPKERLTVAYQRAGATHEAQLLVAAKNDIYEMGYAGFFSAANSSILAVEDISPAAKAGLQVDDVIVGVAGMPLTYWELRLLLQKSGEHALELNVQRGKQTKTLFVTPLTVDGKGRIGVSLVPEIALTLMKYNLPDALVHSYHESTRLAFFTFEAFKKMIRGKLSPKNLSGPIEIAKFSKAAWKSGATSFLMLIAFISLQIGLVNLFPVPGLDGGLTMIYTIEAIIRRSLPQRLKMILIYCGFALLIALMTFVIFNDVAKTLPAGWKSIIPFLK